MYLNHFLDYSYFLKPSLILSGSLAVFETVTSFSLNLLLYFSFQCNLDHKKCPLF